jgi:HYR domain-containing protein
MFTKISLFALALALAVAPRASAQPGSGPNGTNPRPFYNIAHNPNTLEMAALALANGANALEPDVIVLPDGAVGLPFFLSDPTGLVMYHDNSALTHRVPLTLEEYLDGVHGLAKLYPSLAMIQLDVKPQAAKQQWGQPMLDAIRNHLNHDGVNLNVIINVGTRDDAVLFTDIYSQLGEREGVSVDGEDDPAQVVGALKQAAFGNISYGDGTLGPGPNLARAIDWASFLKASWGVPRTIGDVYSIANLDMMDFFIDAGADGIIPDHFVAIPPFPGLALTEYDPLSVPFTIALGARIGAPLNPSVRLATREDNPFKPDVQAYGLEVRTMDVTDGGTDGPLKFTLEGCRGTAEVTVHTGIAPNLTGTGRMERGNTDHVTIPSLNLGKLTRLTIVNNGGDFDAPDWSLADVAVSSAHYIAPDLFGDAEYQATFNATVHQGATVSLDLTPNFAVPEPTIACPAPIAVNNAPGQCSAVVTFTPKADSICSDATASSTPASGSVFQVGTTNVTSVAASPAFPNSHPSCSFAVTVKDVEAPIIACPAPMTVDATGPLGTTVTFAPTAGDNCSTTITSSPAPGSVFAIGTTTVTSTAQDPSLNQSSCSFTVHVKGAAEQLADLVAQVNALGIGDGLKNALVVKLDATLAALAANTPGCELLNSFISLVQGQSGKQITAGDADALIQKATQIRTVLGC